MKKLYFMIILLMSMYLFSQVDTTKFVLKKGQVSDYYIPIVSSYSIKGRVIDEYHQPIANVLVMIKNSPISCITDSIGDFQFSVSITDKKLQFYYPKKEFLEISLQGDTIFNVKLLPDNKSLSPVEKAKITTWYNPYDYHPRTYCNPMNIGYTFEYYNNNSKEDNCFRSAADPMIQPYKGEYYLFTSNQSGFYVSKDLLKWKFYYSPTQRKPDDDDQCAPATEVIGDSLVFIGSTYNDLPVWYSMDPKSQRWKHLSESMILPHWDPALFLDSDQKMYLYYGSSNEFPLKGVEVHRNTFQPIGEVKNLISLHPNLYGWERFGMNNDDSTSLKPFIEGAFMTKYNGKYYLQYGAPGTEFKVYSDGVYVSDNALSGFEYQKHNPFSYKPGGFVQGAGHGGTFKDRDNHYWHVATCMLSLKYKFERRIGVYPTGFDKDGIMYSNTSFGDYPTFTSQINHPNQNFSGWMLLSLNKKTQVSSTDSIYIATHAADENMRTFWSAKTSNPGEWFIMDLSDVMLVYAVQTNFYEHQAYQYGKAADIYHQYKIYHSLDGENWEIAIDKSNNDEDQPHDYVELLQPLSTRFLKIENVHMPAGKFAIMDFRVFGKKEGNPPQSVKNLKIVRDINDSRNALIQWDKIPTAYGYNIYYGIAPDKLYNCITVYGNTFYDMRGLDKGTIYYFNIEVLSETGISKKSKTIKN